MMGAIPETFRAYNRKYHYVGSVDDKGRKISIIKFWSFPRRSWVYEAKPEHEIFSIISLFQSMDE